MMAAMPERHVEDPKVVELAARPTIAVRVEGAQNEIAGLFADHLPRVFAKLNAIGATLASPPYGRYHDFRPELVDVEIGIGVAAAPEGLPPLAACESGDVGASELPAGPAAMVTHLGPYNTLSEAYDRLHTWIHEQGREEGSGPWESYADDPAVVTDHALLRTEIFWPLA
jgi:effector-binding domain-containing protein